MRIILGLPCFLIVILFFVPNLSQARELHGRLGVGFNSEFANSSLAGGVPGVSLKYGLTRDIGFEVIAGVATSSPTNSVTAVKLAKHLFMETNLNFSFFLGGGILSGGGNSGAEFMGGFGAEFFIPGIESLGFSTDVGASFDNLSGSFVVKTLGVSFLNAGIHFYF